MLSRLSLRYRIALVIFLLEACMLGAVLSVSLLQSRQTAFDFNESSQKASLDLLANLSITALLTGEYTDYQLYIDDVHKQPFIDAIVLAGPQKVVVASTEVGYVGRNLGEAVNEEEPGWRIQPVQSAAGILGTLAVRYSNTALTNSYRETRNLALATALTGMLIIALVGLATGFALTRRLQCVADAARRFSDGDAAARSQVGGHDEVAKLSRNVNRMADTMALQKRELSEQSAYIGLLLNSTAEAIYGVDTQGICTFANPACVHMLGYAHESEIVGKAIHSLIHHSYPDGQPYPMEQCRIRLSTLKGQVVHAEDEVHWRKDGSSFPVEYWSRPMYRDGLLVGAVVTFVDISERKQTEAAIARHTAWMRTLASANEMLMRESDDQAAMESVCAILVAESGFRMAWIGLMGEDGVRVHPIAEAGFEDDYLAKIEIRCDDSATGQGPTGKAIRLNRTIVNNNAEHNAQFTPWRERALTHGYLSSAATPIHVDGKIVGALNVCSAWPNAFGGEEILLLEKLASDLSQHMSRNAAARELQRHRDRLEELVKARTMQLEAANKELEAFSFSVSHDLRAPLRAIDGFSLALMEDYDSLLDAAGRDYLQRVRNSAQLMSTLIDDMLKLSRVTRTPLQSKEIDLARMARDIVRHLQATSPERQVQVEIASDLKCIGDEGLVRIALENLLGNAWKYTSKTAYPHIVFDIETTQGETRFRVQDNGVGFDMQYADKLFGAFQRLHHRDDFEGTGIGLATVQRIVHRHGGKVWAEAEPGKGATFYFTLG